jgi:dihydrofolate reductase
MPVIANLSIIAALSDNRVIGVDNRLPWRLPADLAHFKRLTMGKPIVMGRRTWESLPGLLPHRTHVVVSRDPGYEIEGGIVVNSIEQALELVRDVDEIMVVGGANLYAQFLPSAARLYLTYVHAAFDGDAYFPELDPQAWRETSRERHSADARNSVDFSFVTLERLPDAH